MPWTKGSAGLTLLFLSSVNRDSGWEALHKICVSHVHVYQCLWICGLQKTIHSSSTLDILDSGKWRTLSHSVPSGFKGYILCKITFSRIIIHPPSTIFKIVGHGTLCQILSNMLLGGKSGPKLHFLANLMDDSCQKRLLSCPLNSPGNVMKCVWKSEDCLYKCEENVFEKVRILWRLGIQMMTPGLSVLVHLNLTLRSNVLDTCLASSWTVLIRGWGLR